MLKDKDIEIFRRDGAAILRDLFDPHWIELLRRGVEENLANPSSMATGYTDEGQKGRFFGDYCSWDRIEAYREFLFNSPAAEIAAHCMGSTTARLFHEHVLVKEPGTAEITPWHHDQPYYPIDGDHIVSLWTPLDPVSKDVCVQFVKGSHLWGKLYYPRMFKSHDDYGYEGEGFETVPDIDAGEYDILSWEMEPGDTIVFHARTLHGAPGTEGTTNRRRAFASRWLGDDAVYAKRPGTTSPPLEDLTLTPGDPMEDPRFPIVWQQA